MSYLRVFWDGLLLRCPRCHRGRMFGKGFEMRQTCPVCELPFERSSGEITGGMGINITVTLCFVVAGALVIGFNQGVPLWPSLLGLALFALVFPIAFYRSSRGLWAGVLYLTGDNEEPD